MPKPKQSPSPAVPELPKEVWNYIFDKMDPEKLAAVRSVNKTFRDGVDILTSNEFKLSPETKCFLQNVKLTSVGVALVGIYENLAALQVKLEKKEDKESTLNNLLFEACYSGDVAGIQYLLDKGADPTKPYVCTRYKEGYNHDRLFRQDLTPLHMVFMRGHWDSLELLWKTLEARNQIPNLDTLQDGSGNTVLHTCCNSTMGKFSAKGDYSRMNFIKFAIQHGAKPEHLSRSGKTAIDLLKDVYMNRKEKLPELEKLFKYKETKGKDKGKGKALLEKMSSTFSRKKPK